MNSSLLSYCKVLKNFVEFIKSDKILEVARICPNSFTRNRLISLFDLIFFLIFRHGKTINEDISFFFQNHSSPSKQALLKREALLNYDIWFLLIQFFYQQLEKYNLLHRTYKGHLVIAIDGSTALLPSHPALNQIFGGALNQSTPNKEDIITPKAKLSTIYDPLNKVILGFFIQPHDTSEITMMFEQLEKLLSFLTGKKVIFLLDRYYGSAEFFTWCEMNNFHYIVRAKKNFYKKAREQLDPTLLDVELDVEIDEVWQKRLKRIDVKNYIHRDPKLRLRLVKSEYGYIEKSKIQRKDKTWYEKEISKESQIEYFTNLDKNIFSKEEIEELYHEYRWDIETAYNVIKNDLELEQVHSASPIALINMFYGKIILFNLEMGFCALAQDELEEGYIPNNRTIINEVRTIQFIKKLMNGKLKIEDIKRILREGIRKKRKVEKNRHYSRGGRFLKSIPQKKYRIGGRSNPKVRKIAGGFITIIK